MISVKKINEKKFEILIKPNSSLNGTARILFLLSIFILCGGIAIIFYIVGATLILPFAGIELAVVFFAFYLNFRWSDQKEIVTLSLDHVLVEKGRKTKEYSWKEFRTFTAFEIEKSSKDQNYEVTIATYTQISLILANGIQNCTIVFSLS